MLDLTSHQSPLEAAVFHALEIAPLAVEALGEVDRLFNSGLRRRSTFAVSAKNILSEVAVAYGTVGQMADAKDMQAVPR